MPVYVDDMRAPFGRLIMCHMIADTHEELISMARTIGVQLKWIQHPNTWQEHFDIALSKRAMAVAAGAIEITWRQCAATGELGDPATAEEWLREDYRRERARA